MVAQKKETAEQKLLKMIEASGGQGAEGAAVVKTKSRKPIQVLGLLKTINKVLVVAVVVSGVMLLNELWAGTGFLNKSVTFAVDNTPVKRATGAEVFIPTIQNLSFYMAAISYRDLFRPYEEKRERNDDAISEANRKILNKTRSLKLVGVSWLDRIETASVMIEDTDKKVTHFLQKGEKLGDIIVKTIYADSAVLGYEDEEIIIRYDKSQM